MFTHVSEVDKLGDERPIGPLKLQSHRVIAHVGRDVLLYDIASLKQV